MLAFGRNESLGRRLPPEDSTMSMTASGRRHLHALFPMSRIGRPRSRPAFPLAALILFGMLLAGSPGTRASAQTDTLGGSEGSTPALDSTRATPGERWVKRIELADAIGPVTARFAADEIEKGEAAGAEAVVLELDTPGGLDVAMRELVKAILAAGVPVIVYVGPSGGRAASAGLYITMAAPLAAMAPGTNIGAAT